MKLKGKLIIAFVIAIMGVITLSMSNHRAMHKTIDIANAVKSDKLSVLLSIEKIASLGGRLTAGIQSAVNTASEDGLQEAEQSQEAILEALDKHASMLAHSDLKPLLDKLPGLVAIVLESGNALAMAVIDQEFDEIPDATQVLKAANQDFEALLASLQQLVLADFKKSVGLMVEISSKGARRNSLLASALILLMVGLACFLVISFIRPLRRVVASLKDVAEGEGDLTKRITDRRRDEIGELAHWFNLFAEKLHTTIRNIAGSAETLRFSSKMLNDLAGAMNQDVDIVKDNTEAVKTDADTINGNANAVASAMEQTSTNVNLIASSAEEMSATIGEIAQNTAKARTITGNAVSQAIGTSERIDRLGEAVSKIGKVSETINEISDQTNLLALNATIEAARAGEAGKGFAVVANEIKGLALQTAEATQEIGSQIHEIQHTAGSSVEEVKAISVVIQDVDDIVSTIAASIEEQSTVTSEIAGNVANASMGAKEVNQSMLGSVQGVERMSVQVKGIHAATTEMAYRSSKANLSAEDLAAIAGEVEGLVNQFKLRAAKFDMGAVKGAHLNWRYKLHAVMKGHEKLRPEEVASHQECAFGHWIESPEGQALRTLPAFETVYSAHENVHRIAREMVEASHDGQAEALTDLMDAFEDTRHHFFNALDALYQS